MTVGRARAIADDAWMSALMALDRSARAAALAGDTRRALDIAAGRDLLTDVANGWCGRINALTTRENG